jgi:hypothetical protein
MRDPVEIFRDNLAQALASGAISKSELHRKTKIARPTIDSYLSGAEPGLRAVGKIADALERQSWEMIKPLGAEPTPAPAEALAAAALTDPALRDLLGLWAKLDDVGRQESLYAVRNLLKHAAVRQSAPKKKTDTG